MAEKATPEHELPETEQTAPAAEAGGTAAAAEQHASGDKSDKKKSRKSSKEQQALDALQAQFDELNDRHMRMAAEYDNFRKRSQREREGVHAEAVSHAVSALLSTFDNLERALAAETADAEYKKGVELTHKQLLEAFESLHVKRIDDAPGTAFDPNVHNAVQHIEDDSLGENVIAECFQHGFIIGDKVIRHSMVKVAN